MYDDTLFLVLYQSRYVSFVSHVNAINLNKYMKYTNATFKLISKHETYFICGTAEEYDIKSYELTG